MSASAPRPVTLPALEGRTRVFRDRTHAGELLAGMLADALPAGAIVLAIPAGGVPVGAELARRLRLPLDLAVVSKVTLPGDTERGYGAVAFDGTVRLNEPLIEALGLDAATIEAGLAATRERVSRRVRTLRGGRPLPALGSSTAVLVDDGLASGITMAVAVEAVRRAGAARIVVAVPTGHEGALERLAPLVDELYCANARAGRSFAVADAYRRWADVSEEEVRAILDPGRRP